MNTCTTNEMRNLQKVVVVVVAAAAKKYLGFPLALYDRHIIIIIITIIISNAITTGPYCVGEPYTPRQKLSLL